MESVTPPVIRSNLLAHVFGNVRRLLAFECGRRSSTPYHIAEAKAVLCGTANLTR